MLTALRMELRSLQDLRTAPEKEFNEHLDGAKRLAEQSLRSLSDMAMGLRPSMLDDLGLGSAVQWQARQFSKHTGIPVNVDVDGSPDPTGTTPDLHLPHRAGGAHELRAARAGNRPLTSRCAARDGQLSCHR